MDKEGFNFIRVAFIKANGWMIKCMDMENYTMKMEELLIKEIGEIMNFQALEEFLMSLHKKCKDPLISEILLILVINGFFMRGILKMIVSMVKAKLDFPMAKFLMETSLKTVLKGKVIFIQ